MIGALSRRNLLAGAPAALLAPTGAAPPDTQAVPKDAALVRLALEQAAQSQAKLRPASPWRTPAATQDDFIAEVSWRAVALIPVQLAQALAAPGALAPADRLVLETVVGGLQREIDLETLLFTPTVGRPFAVEPRAGVHRLALTGLGGPTPAAATAEAYLTAVRRLAAAADFETSSTVADAREHGVRLPAALHARTLASVEQAAALAGERSPLVAAAPADAPGLRARVVAAVDGELRPALARQADQLRALSSEAPEVWGLWRLKRGDAIYAAALRAGSGTDLSPTAAEARVREAVAGHTREMDSLLRARGLTQGGVGERLRALMRDPAGLYPDTLAGRERAVADMNARLALMRARAPQVIADLPTGEVAVRRESPADEAHARAGYREVHADGGLYSVDLHDIAARPAWTLAPVACHETVPGHLVQMPIERRLHVHPLQARYATGYTEGWAVYAEGLAGELGAYDDSPLSRIGHLQSQLFRLSRAVIDAGVHLHRWSPERARAELAALYGDALFNPLEVEVERVVTAPGTGGADAFAALELARLRRAHRGDLRPFHAAVLERGPWPTRLLEQAVALGPPARA